MKEAVKCTGIEAKRIYEWAALSHGHVARFKPRISGGGTKPSFVDLKNLLTSWVCAQRESKLIVSISSLKEEAKNKP